MLIAQKNLSLATFRSPIAGVVSQIGVNTPGASAMAGGLAFEVVGPGSIYFSSTADQNEVGLIDKGDSVKVTLDAYEDKTFDSKVETVGLTPKAGESETVYHIKVSLPGTNGIRVGMTGDASLILEEKDNVLFVDPLFVKSDSEGKYVLRGPNKEKVRVVTGLEGEDAIEMVSGLSEGDVLYQK
jgi:HlyD family secretion protein